MDELNTTQAVDTIEQESFDTLTMIDLGDSIVLSQVAEDETLHNVVIGLDQAAELYALLGAILEETDVD